MLTCRECGEEVDEEGFCPFCRTRIESYSVSFKSNGDKDGYLMYLKELPKIRWEMIAKAMGIPLSMLKRGLPAP